MSATPKADALHALKCSIQEQHRETNEIRRLNHLVIAAERRLELAKSSEIACHQKLLGM